MNTIKSANITKIHNKNILLKFYSDNMLLLEQYKKRCKNANFETIS